VERWVWKPTQLQYSTFYYSLVAQLASGKIIFAKGVCVCVYVFVEHSPFSTKLKLLETKISPFVRFSATSFVCG